MAYIYIYIDAFGLNRSLEEEPQGLHSLLREQEKKIREQHTFRSIINILLTLVYLSNTPRISDFIAVHLLSFLTSHPPLDC